MSAVVLTSALFVAASIVPVVNASVVILVPLPLLFFYMKYGDVRATGIFIVSLSLASFVLAILEAAGSIYALYLLGASGLMLSAILHRSRSVEKAVVYTAAGLVVFALGILLVRSALAGVTPFDFVETYVAVAVRESIDAYSTTGASSDQVAFLRDNTSWVTSMMMQLMPSLVVTGACFIAWLNAVAGKMLCRTMRVTFPDPGDLTRWKLDDRVIWFAIASGIMVLIPFPSVRVSGLNMLILALFLYLLQGMAVVSYYFERKGVPLYLTLPAYILIFIQAFFVFAVVVVGVADMWIDFRKLQRADGSPEGM